MKRECYQLEGWVEGILIEGKSVSQSRFDIVLSVLDYDHKLKQKAHKPFSFKALGEKRANEARIMFENHKGCLTKVVYKQLADEKKENKKGEEFLAVGDRMIVNIESAGADPEPVKEEPTIEREPESVIDDSSDLPF